MHSSNMLFIVLYVVIPNFIHATESVPLAELFELSKSVAERWHFKGITFIDASDTEGTDNSTSDIHSFLKLHTENVMAFLPGPILTTAHPDYLKNGAVVVNSENSLLLKHISMGLIEKLTWFVPAGIDLTGIDLRLDSNMYLFEKVNSSVIFHEVFAVKNGPQIRNPVGTWTGEKGLIIKEQEMWERRRSLSNVTLLNTLQKATLPPLLTITQTNTGIKTIGYMSDMMEELAAILELNIHTDLAPDVSKLKSGSINPMLEMLAQKEVDICNMGLGMSMERASVTDFTLPLLRQKTTLLIKKPTGGVLNVLAYILAFTDGTWIAVGLTAVTMVMCLMAMGKFEQKKFGFYLGVVFISLLQKDHHYTGKGHSAKAIVFIVGMTSYMIFVYFFTVITSYITALDSPIPIKSFFDILKYDYRMVTVQASVFETFVVSSKPPSALYDIYHQDMKHRPGAFLPLDKVLQEVRANPKTVVFALPNTLYGHEDVVALRLEDNINTYHVIYLQKDSEFTGLLNYYILKMKQGGLMNKVQRKWITQTTRKNDQIDNAIIVLSYDNLIFPCLMLLFGVALAWIGLALEIAFKRCSSSFDTSSDIELFPMSPYMSK